MGTHVSAMVAVIEAPVAVLVMWIDLPHQPLFIWPALTATM